MRKLLLALAICSLAPVFALADYKGLGWNVIAERENLFRPYNELKQSVLRNNGALNADGSINKDAPGYRKAVEELKPIHEDMLKTARTGEVKRNAILEHIYSNAGAERPAGTGSDPTTGRGIFSDNEGTAKSGKDYERIAKEYEKYARDNGLTYERRGDYINIKELDVPVHRPAGPQDAIGSSAHDARVTAQTGGTETAGSAYGQKKYQGVGGDTAANDVKGKALDSVKKMQESLTGTAETPWQRMDQQQKIAKETNRIREAAGQLEDPHLKAVKEGMDPDLIPEMKEPVKERALTQTKEAWQDIEKKNARNIDDVTKKIKDPEIPQAEKQKLKAELNDSLLRQEKTTRVIMGEDGGSAFTAVTGKTPETSIKESRVKVVTTIKAAITSTASTFNPLDPVIGFVKTPTNVSAGAGAALTGLFLYETWREKKKEQQPWESEAEVAGKALWEATGMPGAIGIGDDSAKKALKEYQDCIKAGRKDCSKLNTVLKANYYAVKDASVAVITGVADIPGFVINTPLRWNADAAEETAKEMEKRVQEYRPVGAARKLANELSVLARDAESRLKALDDLEQQAEDLQRQAGPLNAIQERTMKSAEKLNTLCFAAREMNKQASSVKNPAEMTANFNKRLAAVKQLAAQTCAVSDQTVKAFNEGRIDEKGLQTYKGSVKSSYLDQAEQHYSYARQELTLLTGAAKESTAFIGQARDALKEYAEYAKFTQAVAKDAARLLDESGKTIVQLNNTAGAFNNTRARFFSGLKYFYQEKSREQQDELVEIARGVEKLKIDTEKAAGHERKVKNFYVFAVDVTRVAQMVPQPCPELDQLLGKPQDSDPLTAAADEAAQKLEQARQCYAGLNRTVPVKAHVSVSISPSGGEVFVGDALTFTASVSPVTTGAQYYYRWIINNQESGGRGNAHGMTVSRTGSYTIKVEAFRAVGKQGQKIGEAVHSLTAREKEQIKANASMYISGPSTLKTGQSGTYTGMISQTNVPESSLYFNWTIDGKAAGSGKTVSFTGSTAGSHTISAELWYRGRPEVRLGQIGYAVVVQAEQKPPAPAVDRNAEAFDKCIKDVRKKYDGALKYFQEWKSAPSDKKVTLYICGGIGTNWQESCPEDHTVRCQQRDKCIEGGGGNACYDYFQEICRISALKREKKGLDEDIAKCEKKYSRQAAADMKTVAPLPAEPAAPKLTPRK